MHAGQNFGKSLYDVAVMAASGRVRDQDLALAQELVQGMSAPDEYGRVDVLTTMMERLPEFLMERRHRAGVDDGDGDAGGVRSAGDWKIRDRTKTCAVGLVMCLNVGTDPPDVTRVSCRGRVCLLRSAVTWLTLRGAADPSVRPPGVLAGPENDARRAADDWRCAARAVRALAAAGPLQAEPRPDAGAHQAAGDVPAPSRQGGESAVSLQRPRRAASNGRWRGVSSLSVVCRCSSVSDSISPPLQP
jgi:hypothetical protein